MSVSHKDPIERAQALLWRRAAHWMYLRWWVEQDRAHWPAITQMPLEKADAKN